MSTNPNVKLVAEAEMRIKRTISQQKHCMMCEGNHPTHATWCDIGLFQRLKEALAGALDREAM